MDFKVKDENTKSSDESSMNVDITETLNPSSLYSVPQDSESNLNTVPLESYNHDICGGGCDEGNATTVARPTVSNTCSTKPPIHLYINRENLKEKAEITLAKLKDIIIQMDMQLQEVKQAASNSFSFVGVSGMNTASTSDTSTSYTGPSKTISSANAGTPDLVKVQVENLNLKKKLIELAAKFEDVTQKSIEEQSQVSRLENSVRTTPSLFTSNLQHEASLATNEETFMSQESQSLPNQLVSGEGNALVMNSKKIKELEDKIKAHEANINKLKDMNIQWQLYNKQREKTVKSLQEKLENKVQELNQLQSETGANSSMSFTPAQQEYIDSFYQRIRREADRYLNERDTARVEAREAKRRQDEAEKKLSEQTSRMSALDVEIASQISQTEELRTALIVATRNPVPQTNTEDSETISSLREALRQYENDIRVQTAETEGLRQENERLEQRLRQNTPTVVRQTIVNHGNGQTTTIQRTNRNLSAEGYQAVEGSFYGDIETD